MANVSYLNMMPKEDVECFSGYDDNFEKVMQVRYGSLDDLFEKLGHSDTLYVSYRDIKRIPVKPTGIDALTEVFANSILKLGDAAMMYRDTESGTMLEVVMELQDDEVGLSGREGSA